MGGNALDEIEEAVDLLRQQSARCWVLYLLGAVPFTLAVLAFARDLASGYGADQCLVESFFCAVVFFWASFWKARFASALLASMGAHDEPMQRNTALQCAFVQGALQAFKLLILPLAVISIIPLPWISALFRSVNAEANRPGATISGVLRRSAAQASTEPAKNWLGLLICCVAAVIVFANVFAMLMLLPESLKIFTGTENQWTRNAGRLANANTFAVAVAITWLVIDPVLQAYSTVRSFYFQARSDGRDLLMGLRRITATWLLLAFAMSTGVGWAQPARSITPNLSGTDVKRAVEQVVKKKEFSWLRKSNQAPDNNWFGARLVRDIDRVIKRVGSWIEAFGKWIDKLLHPDEDGHSGKNLQRPSAPRLQWLLYSLIGILATALTMLVRIRRTGPLRVTAGAGARKLPGLSDDDVLGAERTDEQWLALAHDCTNRGELRLAIRAMYLSNLAYLGAEQLIGIAKAKSNAIYEKELRARCRAASVCDAFSRANRNYERAWYGMHEVTPELTNSFEREVWAVRGRA